MAIQVLAVVNSSSTSIPVPSIRSIIGSFLTYSGSKLLLLLFLILSSFSIISYEKTNGNTDWKNFFKSIESYCWKIRFLNTNKIYLLLTWLLTPIYNTKYTIVASVAFYLLVAKGISNISHKYVKSIITCVIIAFSFLYVWEYYTKINKEQWKDVANHIDTNAKNGDLLLFNAYFCQDRVFDYYSKRTDLIKKGFPEKTTYVDEENIKGLGPTTLEGYNRAWLILSHSSLPYTFLTSCNYI